jgi:hypothetical protein
MMEAVLFTIIMGLVDKDNKDMKYGRSTLDKIKDVDEIKVQSLLDVFFAPPVKSCSIKSLMERGILRINSGDRLREQLSNTLDGEKKLEGSFGTFPLMGIGDSCFQ